MTALAHALCDLDKVPTLLESIRIRTTTECQWLLQAEKWGSKAIQELEQLAVHYETNDEAYKEPKHFMLLKALEKNLDAVVGTSDLSNLFFESIDNIEMVELLLPFVDPSAEGNKAIWLAVENGNVAVVDRLLEDPRVDPSAEGNNTICLAADYGNLAMVDRLLADPRVDPSAECNEAICVAAEEGHMAIVDRLLADPRFDPSRKYNRAIVRASYYGHTAVVKRLLEDPHIDPEISDNQAIRNASCNGHYAIVKLLAAYGCYHESV